jgi:hypothetical protein
MNQFAGIGHLFVVKGDLRCLEGSRHEAGCPDLLLVRVSPPGEGRLAFVINEGLTDGLVVRVASPRRCKSETT